MLGSIYLHPCDMLKVKKKGK